MPVFEPDPIGPIRDIKDLVSYIQRQHERIGIALQQALDSRIIMRSTPPKKVFDGLVAGADGVNWNPGSGRGVYLYQDGYWYFLGGSQSLAPIVSVDPTSGSNPPPPPPPPPSGGGTTPPPTTEPPPSGGGGPTYPPPSNIPVEGLAIATIHSISLYWNPPKRPVDGSGNAVDKVVMKYKKETDATWTDGHDLWYDARNSEARGVIVHCAANTRYNIEFFMPDDLVNPAAQLLATTRDDPANWKIWKTKKPSDGSLTIVAGQTLTITEGGDTTNGYIIYDGENTVLDIGGNWDNALVIDCDYIFLRNFKLKNPRYNGIWITPGHHDLVIENNQISGWGTGTRVNHDGWSFTVQAAEYGAIKSWAGADKFGGDFNAGVGPYRMVIQRNEIFDPRCGATSWSDDHPQGLIGIFISNSQTGQNIIRYNKIYNTTGAWAHHVMDGIGGGDNFSKTGGSPGPDSDIYGNYVDHCWDDCIEAEGSGRCVKIWGNYLGQGAIGVATTVVYNGPIYVWRNVKGGQAITNYWTYIRDSSGSIRDANGQLYGYVDRDWDHGDRNPFSKNIDTQADSTYGTGMRYLYHNTVLMAPASGINDQPSDPNDSHPYPPASLPIGNGAGVGGGGHNTKTRNNIFQTWKSNWSAIAAATGNGNDFANDVYTSDSYPGAAGIHAAIEISGGSGSILPIKFLANHGWSAWGTGYYQLDSTSPGYQAGEIIPNFSYPFGGTFPGALPDCGAHEGGLGQLVFGLSSDIH